MASRYYNQFKGSLEVGVVSIFLYAVIGVSGAVSFLPASKNKGIKSLSRLSAGVYELTFGDSATGQVDKYQRVLSVAGTVQNGTPFGYGSIGISTDSSPTGIVYLTLTANTSNADGTPAYTDPPNGSALYVRIDLKNSTV